MSSGRSSDPHERPVLFTIGHSNVQAERFLDALATAGVEVLVDVRTTPRSRFAPWSGRERLADLLSERGIDYVFEGAALGGKPADPSLQRDGMPDWEAIGRTASFGEAMARLQRLASERPTAVMCSEEDPERCHRRHLIARHLPATWRVIDIRTGGGKGIRVEEMKRGG